MKLNIIKRCKKGDNREVCYEKGSLLIVFFNSGILN